MQDIFLKGLKNKHEDFFFINKKYFSSLSVKLSEAHKNLDVYKYLDDTIVQQIELSENPLLNKAQEIIKKIKTRKLYKVVCVSCHDVEVN